MSEPSSNGPADLGWNEQSTSRPAHRYAIPAGTREARCKSCGASIFWIVTTFGRRMPVDGDGLSHFATCPDAAKHRRPKTAAPRAVGEQLTFAPKMPVRASDEEE